MYVHDGHAFSGSLEFQPIADIEYISGIHNLLDRLDSEVNSVIKVYRDENDELLGYRKHTGQTFVLSGFKMQQDAINEDLTLEK
eukprot:gene8604-1953_t